MVDLFGFLKDDDDVVPNKPDTIKELEDLANELNELDEQLYRLDKAKQSQMIDSFLFGQKEKTND